MMILLYLRCNVSVFCHTYLVYKVINEIRIFMDNHYYFKGYMDDISLYIMLTGTCARQVTVNKQKHRIVYWHFLCVFLFKSSLIISAQFYL